MNINIQEPIVSSTSSFIPVLATNSEKEFVRVYPGASTSSYHHAFVPKEAASSEICEADYNSVMALFEEIEPYYSKTNKLLVEL